MTDRHAGYIVALEYNIREDDAEDTINALRQIKGVVSVTPVVMDSSLHIGEMRADNIWRNRLLALLGMPDDSTG